MANPVCKVLLTEAALRPPALDPKGGGAVLDFMGLVRPLEDSRPIAGIEYEAHSEMAFHQLEQIAREAIAEFQLDGVLIHHRTGFVKTGEASVLVRTETRHRAKCYRANEWIMNELKKRVPIWKRPRFAEGGIGGSAMNRQSGSDHRAAADASKKSIGQVQSPSHLTR
jgi:molybdopterin synthase catalytic subunit